jgi:putative flippase GtrA
MIQNIKALLANKTDNIFVQLFRYTFVGGIAFIVDFGLLFILTSYVGFHYQLSAVISFVAGLVANYLMSRIWVFSASDSRPGKFYEFMLFSAVGVIGLCLNSIIIYLFTELVCIYYLFSKIISTIVVFLWNFFGRRYLMKKINKSCQEKKSRL